MNRPPDFKIENNGKYHQLLTGALCEVLLLWLLLLISNEPEEWTHGLVRVSSAHYVLALSISECLCYQIFSILLTRTILELKWDFGVWLAGRQINQFAFIAKVDNWTFSGGH